MNIFFESPQRLKIELSGTDLSELGITYDELDYKSERTRSVVHELLHRIGAENEFDPSGKMIIEIFPRGDDGCTMYFTSVRESALAVKRRRLHDVSVWEFDSADSLISAMDYFKSINRKLKSSLYLHSGKYRLILNERPNEACAMALSEFSHRIGERYAALFTAEHGKLISSDPCSDIA